MIYKEGYKLSLQMLYDKVKTLREAERTARRYPNNKNLIARVDAEARVDEFMAELETKGFVK